MVKIISVLSQKGGSSKTTLSVHLACQLKADLPQLSIAIADADPQQSAAKWLRRSDGKTGVVVYPVDEHFKAQLSQISADLIIVDLPPGVPELHAIAALQADLVLVPVGPSVLELDEITPIIDGCKQVAAMDSSKQFLFVPARIQQNTASGRDFRDVLKTFGPVTKSQLGLRVAYADSVMSGVGVNLFAPGSAAHREIQELAIEVGSILKLEVGK